MHDSEIPQGLLVARQPWPEAEELTAFEQLLARYLPRRRWTILFSPRPDWESPIRAGFRGTPHAIRFAELTPEALYAHDLVVPLTLDAVQRLHALSATAALGARIARNAIPVPGPAVVALCDDKLRCAEALRAAGFAAHVPRIGGAMSYPYILKRRHDEFGRHALLVADADAEARHAALLADPAYFRQQLVPGHRERTTHILLRARRVVCSLSIEYTFTSAAAILGPHTPARTGFCECPYLELFAAMLRALGYEGLCCVDHKVVDGRPLVFEINPRFGGSLAPFFFSFLRHLD